MTTTEFVEYLDEALLNASDEWESENPIVGTGTFGSVGMLTKNEGLVVRFHDGTEFQVTVVKSR
jgi:hypothetical protein